MNYHTLFLLALLASTLCTTVSLSAAPDSEKRQLAFPSAEGFGRFATGGRGGDVYHVTNLMNDGKGSLRYGIEKTKGPRTIVFDVSGTIRLKAGDKLQIKDVDGLTIAGQTAPGDGICIRDEKFGIIDSSNIIIRYMRFRLGDESRTSTDTLGIDESNNVILDHVTATWGVDGTMDTSEVADFTLQWSLFGEALHESTHHKGGHAMLMSMRKTAGNVSLHHNLFFSSRNRHPTLGSLKKEVIFDFRNNVVYNRAGSTNLSGGHVNLINNYYRPGPSTKPETYPIRPKAKKDNAVVGYMSGSIYEGNKARTKDNYTAMQWGARDGESASSYPGKVLYEKFRLSREPVAVADRPHTHPADKAYELILNKAGASKRRDAADKRIIAGIRKRTHRLINSQQEVGGWPELRNKPASLDTDQDGMPDKWEIKMKLNPRDPEDRNGDLDRDGYTNLEDYLNALVEMK